MGNRPGGMIRKEGRRFNSQMIYGILCQFLAYTVIIDISIIFLLFFYCYKISIYIFKKINESDKF